MRQSVVRPDPCRINAAFRPTAALNLGAAPGCAPELLDGRVLLVEHKGEHPVEHERQRKNIGERTGGRE
jgi:hypothetical protein